MGHYCFLITFSLSAGKRWLFVGYSLVVRWLFVGCSLVIRWFLILRPLDDKSASSLPCSRISASSIPSDVIRPPVLSIASGFPTFLSEISEINETNFLVCTLSAAYDCLKISLISLISLVSLVSCCFLCLFL